MARPDQVQDPTLRAQIEDARAKMRSGDGTGAVHMLVDAFLYMLREKPELMDATTAARMGQVPLVMRWPALGANLSRESVMAKDPKIEFVRERFAVSEAITYYEFTLDTAVSQGM